jgi:S-(hydroxymethyl)glutathione dehydrogenase/alcohol dehydrogenase
MMRAAVCYAFGKPLVIEEVALAPSGPGEVRVRLEACAICHSDISYMEGAWGGELPAVYGHEAAGVVEAVGEGVADLVAGEHVVVTLIRHCGRCPACAAGTPVLCEGSFPLGRRSPISARDGRPIAQAMRTGAFAEQVGVGAVLNTAAVPAGSSVAVLGAGGVRLNAIQAAALAGARSIVAIDVIDAKLVAARAFGATHVVNSRHDPALDAVRSLTGGRGADYVFVTAGVPGLVEQGLALTRRGGTLVLVGMPATGVTATFDPGSVANDGQKVLGCKMGSARPRLDIPMIIDLYRQGRLKLDELITARYPLEGINEAVAAVNRGEALRNVILF